MKEFISWKCRTQKKHSSLWQYEFSPVRSPFAAPNLASNALRLVSPAQCAVCAACLCVRQGSDVKRRRTLSPCRCTPGRAHVCTGGRVKWALEIILCERGGSWFWPCCDSGVALCEETIHSKSAPLPPDTKDCLRLWLRGGGECRWINNEEESRVLAAFFSGGPCRWHRAFWGFLCYPPCKVQRQPPSGGIPS